jgi:hypothetical protein
MSPSLITRKVNEPFASLFLSANSCLVLQKEKVNEPFSSNQLKVTAPFARVSLQEKFTFDSLVVSLLSSKNFKGE